MKKHSLVRKLNKNIINGAAKRHYFYVDDPT